MQRDLLMSIELPEAYILAKQINKELTGKQIAKTEVNNYQSLQKLGCINRNLADYDALAGGKIEFALSRGLAIRIKINNGWNLLLAPEYGGRILYHQKNNVAPSKFHFKLSFGDETSLTVALTGLGGIQALSDKNLNLSYVYRRDFSNVASPLNDEEFSFEKFSTGLSNKNVNIKSAIVGKEALLVGLSNSSFQDIIFSAKINPKRKASSLSENEKLALYDAVRIVVHERIRAGGKTQFMDLYGNPGNYEPSIGPNMKGQQCVDCGANVEMLSLGGGQVYFCPKCQK
jgi:formamidopyrimidine-DNA glycosylase